MLIEKDYCDYETSRELKELGFVAGLGEGDCGYCLYDDAWHNQVNRPLLYEAQKWLREEKGVVVLVHHLMTEEGDWEWEISYRYRSKGMYHSYEEALSEGVRKAIKILKEDETIHR